MVVMAKLRQIQTASAIPSATNAQPLAVRMISSLLSRLQSENRTATCAIFSAVPK